jgi:hypothetical protein
MVFLLLEKDEMLEKRGLGREGNTTGNGSCAGATASNFCLIAATFDKVLPFSSSISVRWATLACGSVLAFAEGVSCKAPNSRRFSCFLSKLFAR